MLQRAVSLPRNRHVDSSSNVSLDLAYITDRIVVMSMPAISFPHNLYRNDLSQVRAFLNSKSRGKWKIFEFRAEGAGYLDRHFEDRVEHFPFPDHHPPPFKIVASVVDSMHRHLESDAEAICVLHCKAGKGRSGSMACAYLIVHGGWSEADARARFTQKRMKPGYGEGVSIPSQRRYLRYIETWARSDRKYDNISIQIHKMEVWGLKSGVQLSLQHYVEDGREKTTLHNFTRDEMQTLETADMEDPGQTTTITTFIPKIKVAIDDPDLCVELYKGRIVTSLAHFWFNAWFESADGNGGRMEIQWDAMDGWRGLKQKGLRSLDKVVIYWTRI